MLICTKSSPRITITLAIRLPLFSAAARLIFYTLLVDGASSLGRLSFAGPDSMPVPRFTSR